MANPYHTCRRILQLLPAPPGLRARWNQNDGQFYETVICLALIEQWEVPAFLDDNDPSRVQPVGSHVVDVSRAVEPLTLGDGGLELCCEASNYAGMEIIPDEKFDPNQIVPYGDRLIS